jgi:hypothetical protein
LHSDACEVIAGAREANVNLSARVKGGRLGDERVCLCVRYAERIRSEGPVIKPLTFQNGFKLPEFKGCVLVRNPRKYVARIKTLTCIMPADMRDVDVGRSGSTMWKEIRFMAHVQAITHPDAECEAT